MERRKLAIEGDFEIPAFEEVSSVDARFFANPKKAKGLPRGAFAADTSTFRLPGALLEGPAKGSTSSSGKDSVVSRMTSSQRKPPSVLLTAIGERLARRPLTGREYDVGEAGEVRVSPLSVKTELCDISEDEEQSSEGTVGLVGDAIRVSNPDAQRLSRGASGKDICGDADKSGGAGSGLVGAGPGLDTERGLGGNLGERGVGESLDTPEGDAGRSEEDTGGTCFSSVKCDCWEHGDGPSEGRGKDGTDGDDCFSSSPTISVCSSSAGESSSERGESRTES
jgi:hypothetical protein